VEGKKQRESEGGGGGGDFGTRLDVAFQIAPFRWLSPMVIPLHPGSNQLCPPAVEGVFERYRTTQG